MVVLEVHECECDVCRESDEHFDREQHRHLNAVLCRLDEQQRRWVVALESERLGHGGDTRMAVITGLHPQTIRRGRQELAEGLAGRPVDRTRLSGAGRPSVEKMTCDSNRFKDSQPSAQPIDASVQPPTNPRSRFSPPSNRIRLPGCGRKRIEVKQPEILAVLERLVSDEVGGDPMTEQRWVRSSLRHLSERLKEEGHQASQKTVRRLLKSLKFSLKANQRKQGKRGSPERDTQFNYIASQRRLFAASGLPIISVDTKKKELIGEFRQNGRTWCRKPEEVHEHDFPGAAQHRATPFGVYDIGRNAGYVYVGVSNDTAAFAVTSIARWWKDEASVLYPKARELLILADGGGCNGYRTHAWKFNIQENLCDRFGLAVTVCHYPTGCSKWNLVEHRLFSYISINWAGKPMKTLELMLGYIRGTTTATGLRVKAFLDRRSYSRGQTVTREQQEGLNLTSHDVCPQWNYTLRPTGHTTPDPSRDF